MDSGLAPAVLAATAFAGLVLVVTVLVMNRRLANALWASEAATRCQDRLAKDLSAIARAASDEGSLSSTLQRTLITINHLTGAEGSTIILLGEDGSFAGSVVARAAAGVTLSPKEASRVIREGLAGWVCRTREIAVVADTSRDARWLHHDAQRSARAALAVPIVSGADLVGVITLVHTEPAHFRDVHRQLLEYAAPQMALRLRNAQVSEARLKLAERQTLLFEVLSSSTRLLHPGHTAREAADVIARQTPWSEVVIALPAEQGDWVYYGRAGLLPTNPGNLRTAAIGRAFATEQTTITLAGDLPSGERDSPLTHLGQLATPLRSRGPLLGVLSLSSMDPSAFGTEEVRLAESLAEAIALAIENAHLYEAMTGQGARLNAVVQHSRDGLVLVGQEGNLLLLSGPCSRLLQIARSHEWIGRPVDALLTELESNAPTAAEALRSALRALDRPGGQDEFAVGGSVLRWEPRRVPGFGRLLMLVDLTREKQLDMLQRDVTHMLVHDLRSPLTNVMGALNLLRGRFGAASEQADVLDLAERNVERQLRLIASILDVERLESGALYLTPDHFSLRDIADEIVRLASPQATTKGIGLRNSVPARLPMAWGDSTLIGRVLENLVVNALKFSSAGCTIRVRARPDGPGLKVSVADDGPGVPDLLRRRLFERFAAGDQKGRGSGLGLAFCRLAVEAHDGRIWLEDTRQGATFSFWLPDRHGWKH